MKHTNFHSLVEKIKQQEYQELMLAVQAHDGRYKWNDDTERPIIAVNVDGNYPYPDDIEITEVSIVDGILVLKGEDKEFGNSVDFKPPDVFAGHLSFIIDYLPHTDVVTDVSVLQEDPEAILPHLKAV